MNNFILFLLFISVVCFAKEPKFHFKDCVVVKSGFYRDCKGEVESLDAGYKYRPEDYYDVSINSCKGDNKTLETVTFKESELELCKK